MNIDQDFRIVPLTEQLKFGWVFFAYWVLFTTVAIFGIFYVGRLFGFIITHLLNWVIWPLYRAKVNIQSISISPIGGKIHFKNVSIINKDLTISVLNGTLTWRYWLPACRLPSYYGEKASDDRLPCRLHLECDGLELFLYNLCEPYERILEEMHRAEEAKKHYMHHEAGIKHKISETKMKEHIGRKGFSLFGGGRAAPEGQKSLSRFLEQLPLEINVKKGAVTVGNYETPSLIIIGYDKLDGILDIDSPTAPVDCYKIKVEATTYDLNISMKPNISFENVNPIKTHIETRRVSRFWGAIKGFMKGKILYPFRTVSKKTSPPRGVNSHLQAWKGLLFYKVANKSDISELQYDVEHHEYAKYTKILKAKKINITYACDVLETTLEPPLSGKDLPPPEFSIDFLLYDANICYGPWAHRQSQHLIKLFFPTVYKTEKSEEDSNLEKNSTRGFTELKLSMMIMEDSVWRIPTKEASKDAAFLEKYKTTRDNSRAFGWLDIQLQKDTNASLVTSLVLRDSKFENTFHSILENMVIRTSVNNDIMLMAKRHVVNADLSRPELWNSNIEWIINCTSSNLEAFILRDHITLLTDLISDFSSSEPVPYDLFRPFLYQLNLEIDHYDIHLNVNDANIIDNALDLNENCYLTLQGESASLSAEIPYHSIAQPYTAVSYKLLTPQVELLLNTPPWHTVNEFMRFKEFGRTYEFAAQGSYIMYYSVDIDNVDTFTIDCETRFSTVHCSGFLLRYMMNVIDNYFGDFTHFRTTEEYTEELSHEDSSNNQVSLLGKQNDYRSATRVDLGIGTNTDTIIKKSNDTKSSKKSLYRKTTNEIDIWFTLKISDGNFLFPENIYDYESCIGVHCDSIEIDLRYLKYYLDTKVGVYSSYIKRYTDVTPNLMLIKMLERGSVIKNYQVYVTDMHLHQHRMLGVPPSNDSYVIKSDISLGTIESNCDIDMAIGVLNAFKKFIFGFKDIEDLLNYESNTPPALNCFTFTVDYISLKMKVNDVNLEYNLKLSEGSFQFIDLENSNYSNRKDLEISKIEFLVSLINDDQNLCQLTTSVSATNFIRHHDFNSGVQSQREHIALNDAPFHRCRFLLNSYLRSLPAYNNLYGCIPPSSSIPMLSEPITSKNFNSILEYFLLIVQPDFSSEKAPDIANDVVALSSSTEDKLLEPHSPRNLPTFMASNSLEGMLFDLDSFVVELPEVKGFLHVDVLISFGRIYDLLFDNSIMDRLDDIEMDIVHHYLSLLSDFAHCKELKLKCSTVDVALVTEQDLEKGTLLNYIDFKADRINVDFRMLKGPADGIISVPVKEMSSIFFKSDLISSRVFLHSLNSSKQAGSPALSCFFKAIEGYGHLEDQLVWNTNVQHGSLYLDHERLERIFEFLSKLLKEFDDFSVIVGKAISNRYTRRRALLMQLSLAGQDFNINHDAPVITKPAVIVRLSGQHIREEKSWKIITRLRYILNNMPSEWDLEKSTILHKKNFKLPAICRKQFLDVFTKWRSWEISDVEGTYIYRKTFMDYGKDKGSVDFKFRLCLDLFVADIDYKHDKLFTARGFTIDMKKALLKPNIAESSPLHDCRCFSSLLFSADDIHINLQWPVMKLVDTIQSLSAHGNSDIKSLAKNKLCQESALQSVSIQIREFYVDIIMEEIELGLSCRNYYLALFASLPFDAKYPILSITNSSDLLSASLCYNTEELLACHLSFISNNAFLLLDHKCYKIETKLESITVEAGVSKSDEIFLNATESLNRQLNRLYTDLAALSILNFRKDMEGMDESIIPHYSIKLQSNNVSFGLRTLYPLSIDTTLKDLDFSISAAEVRKLSASVTDINFDLSSNSHLKNYMRYSQSKLSVYGDLSGFDSGNGSIEIETGISKVSMFEPSANFHYLLDDSILVFQRISNLKIGLAQLNIMNKGNALMSPFSKVIPPDLKFTMEYAGVLLEFGTTLYIMEFNKIEYSLASATIDPLDISKRYKGHCSVGSLCFLIKDRRIAQRLSKVLDCSFKVLLVNTSVLNFESLQVESSYFRVCLSPTSFIRLLWLENKIAAMKIMYSEKMDDFSTNSFSFADKGRFFSPSLKSAQVLSYNLCVGWIFDIDNYNDSGLIWGYERLFAAYDMPYGKLTLLDAYFCPAYGYASNTFYVKGNERETMNRSYLPSMQIYYMLIEEDGKKDFVVNVKGEELDISLLSDFVTIAEKAIQSVHKVQTLKKAMIDPIGLNRKGKPRNADWSYLDYYPISVRSVKCIIDYAGCALHIYSEDDIENNTCALEIRSPAYEVEFEYQYLPHNLQSHWLRMLVTVNATRNTFFPTCTPIIRDLRRNFSEILNRPINQTPISASNSEKPSINYHNILKSFDLAIFIDIGQQELSLTCEPHAKVQTCIGFEKLAIKVFSNEILSDDPLIMSIEVCDLIATFRHIYSREVGASLSLRHINTVFNLTQMDTIRMYGSTLISEPSLYFNIEHVRDLKVFLELWSVDDDPSLRGDGLFSGKATHDTVSLVSSVPHSSKTSNFTWQYFIGVTGVTADVNLGPSLGIVGMACDTIWTVSEQDKYYTHSLTLSMGEINMCSAGRLGGSMTIKDMNVLSRLSWILKRDKVAMPVISFTLEITSVESKLSSDYNMFFIGIIQDMAIKAFNEIDEDGVVADLLSVAVSLHSLQVFTTSLASANIYDIYKKVAQLAGDNEPIQPKEIREKDAEGASSNTPGTFDSLTTLRTKFSLDIGLLRLQVSTSTLFDSHVLVLKATNITANTLLESSVNIKTELNWQLHKISLSLSTLKHDLDDKKVNEIGIMEYVALASSASGGMIVDAPSIYIAMTVWELPPSNVLEYLFSSSFGGTIDVKWNLAPIGFFRELWNTHVNSMKMRHVHEGARALNILEGEQLEDMKLEVNLGDEYKYVPLQPPHIEVPRIKELGDATPPIEWFGVNRDSFPGLTHQVMIIPLQQLSKFAERKYAKALRR
ncbi:HHR145Cp [Eremothecium sinecaudum]|uniref:HHR145Cp n=1 Tax=Eremothecium sinecaudum TaxID=45286 RepID=A0A0X8HWV1_9SACH|nr:HHR145Cp [Eremothecium sinecaudum]AMD22914.1 HHR145Cp [Eremothecium sinecaudum]